MVLKVMEILIVKLSAIGDVVHTLPVLDVLYHQFPESTINWVVEEKASDIIKDHPYLEKVIISKRKRWLKDLKKPSLWYPVLREIMGFIRELRAEKYDVGIDFQGLLKSGILVFLSRGKRKMGYSNAREMSSFFLNEKVPFYPLDKHAVERNINLVRYLGAKPDEINFPVIVAEEDRKKIDSFISAHGLSASKPLIAIHSQAGWATKRWNPLKMARFADKLVELYAAQIVFTGGSDENLSIEAIMSQMQHSSVNAAGETSLKELACLISLSRLMITVDSGPMHIASAMGTPTVVLFGPTAPWRTGPYCNNALIIRKQLSCSPCFKRECDSRTCMEEISIDEVLKAVDRQIKFGEKDRVVKKEN